MDLVFLPVHLHRNLLLHPLLHRFLPRHRTSLRGVPMRKRPSIGKMLLTLTENDHESSKQDKTPEYNS